MSAKEFNQLEYIKEYNKQHYKDFKAKLKKEDYEEIEKIRKQTKLNKTQFIKETAIFYKENKKN